MSIAHSNLAAPLDLKNLALGCTLVLLMSPALAQDQPKSDANPADAAAVLRKARVQFLVDAMKHFEVRVGDEGVDWRYAFGPMSIYALTAKLDSSVVWEIPERKIFGNPRAIQYVSPYMLGAGEKFPE